jgi:hypothetical protein
MISTGIGLNLIKYEHREGLVRWVTLIFFTASQLENYHEDDEEDS